MHAEKQVYIIFSKYYDFDQSRFTLGGIQTYLHHLIAVFQERGYRCHVFGTGFPDRAEVTVNRVRIVNVPTPQDKTMDKQVATILNEVKKEFCDETDILLFATDCQIAPNHASRSIVIQHGITWDIPLQEGVSVSKNNLFIFRKVRSLWKKLQRISMAKRVVCVDHNYVNWYRASTAYEAVPMTVIPNFTNIPARGDKPDGNIRIIFARRLETYRGTTLFANVMSRILAEYDNVDVTVAGTGPAEASMRRVLEPFSDRVTFTSYQAEDSFKIHADKHIAVVPTVGSEGTSLSLLEAMAAGCATVCTNVGGMTNIVLDGYNGLMISPREEDLYKAVKTLIDNEDLRRSLADNGYAVAASAFSLERWQEKWHDVIAATEKG